MILSSFKKVYSNYRYAVLSAVIAFIIFAFSVWIPNMGAILSVLTLKSATFFEKLEFVFTLFYSITTNFTVVSASYIIAIAILFGVNISMLTYYIRSIKTGSVGGVSALGLGGLVSGVFGIGCAACGTFILTSLLGLFGAAGVLAFLPFGGEEFGLLGVGLLLFSIYVLSKRIYEPRVCPV